MTALTFNMNLLQVLSSQTINGCTPEIISQQGKYIFMEIPRGSTNNKNVSSDLFCGKTVTFQSCFINPPRFTQAIAVISQKCCAWVDLEWIEFDFVGIVLTDPASE